MANSGAYQFLNVTETCVQRHIYALSLQNDHPERTLRASTEVGEDEPKVNSFFLLMASRDYNLFKPADKSQQITPSMVMEFHQAAHDAFVDSEPRSRSSMESYGIEKSVTFKNEKFRNGYVTKCFGAQGLRDAIQNIEYETEEDRLLFRGEFEARANQVIDSFLKVFPDKLNGLFAISCFKEVGQTYELIPFEVLPEDALVIEGEIQVGINAIENAHAPGENVTDFPSTVERSLTVVITNDNATSDDSIRINHNINLFFGNKMVRYSLVHGKGANGNLLIPMSQLDEWVHPSQKQGYSIVR